MIRMNRATKIKLAATAAAQAHERTTGHYSYAYHCGSLESHIDALCRELEAFKPRASGSSERETTYSHDGGELFVHFNYESGESQTRDCPGYPESACVNSVFANGMDITPLLDATTMESIEAHCLQEVENAAQQAEYDRGEERHQSRRDEELA